jgi:hypothetical protein
MLHPKTIALAPRMRVQRLLWLDRIDCGLRCGLQQVVPTRMFGRQQMHGTRLYQFPERGFDPHERARIEARRREVSPFEKRGYGSRKHLLAKR